LWNDVLNACREFVGGASAGIFAKNVRGNRSQLFFTDGRLGAESTKAYFDGLSTIDPSNIVQVLAEVDQAVITSEKLDPEEFSQTRFAREWAQPMGLVDVVVAPIERRGSWAALFGILLHERDGLGSEDMRNRVTMLAPHIRRAIRVGDILGNAKRQTDSFRETIDGLAVGVFLVDSEGRLVHANPAATALFGSDRSIATGAAGLLRLDRTGMRDLLPHGDHSTSGSKIIETQGGERLVAHVLPLTSGGRKFSGLGGDAVAALFVQRAEFDPPSIPGSLAAAFDLTPGELRVLLATLRNDKVVEVAEELGVAPTTVKTHLSRIFGKTDTRRQADLFKLVAAFSSPLKPRTMGSPCHPNG
ncbi:MAG: PAS domain-containing protein, partial [Rhizobiaceae bacterium]